MQGADTGGIRRAASRMALAADHIAADVTRARTVVAGWQWVGPDADRHATAALSLLSAASAIAADLDRLAGSVRNQAFEQERVSR